jgi:hypothetical protein
VPSDASSKPVKVTAADPSESPAFDFAPCAAPRGGWAKTTELISAPAAATEAISRRRFAELLVGLGVI